MSASPSVSPRRDRAAILFADVHGYAQLMDRNEQRTYERVSQSIRLLRSLIGDYGGSVMNVAGDGVLALFETAAQALKFAVTMQQELRKETVWSAERDPVAFRIGINYGEVLVDEDANVLKAHPNFSIAHWRTVPPHKNPDDLAAFIEGLRLAGLR